MAWCPRQTPSSGVFAPKRSHRIDDDAGVGRVARTGRNDDPVGGHLGDPFERDLVVAVNDQIRAQLAQVLDEVVGERIVVVDDEDAHGYSPSEASSSARISARALSHVSSNSAAGSESITMPAPACTRAVEPDMTTVRIAMQKSRLPAKSR